MVQNYILKRELLSSLSTTNIDNIDIPTNDFQAWTYNKNKPYLWIYNKIQICQSQNIPCAPIGVKPDSCLFPVIVKPITNLYGMGYHAYRFNTVEEYQKDIRNVLSLPGMFWSPFFTGIHVSVDLFIRRGKVLWYCAFEGHKNKNKTGVFDNWESLPDYELSSYIRNWVKTNMLKYTGCLNLELIGNCIIEGHLRMGDLNHLDIYDPNHTIMKNVINLYKSKKQDQLHYRIPKVYLVTVFLTFEEYQQCNTISTEKLHAICNQHDIKMVQRDPPPTKVTYPTGGIRMFCLTTDNLTKGLAAQSAIKNKLLHDDDIYIYIYITITITIIITMLLLLFIKRD